MLLRASAAAWACSLLLSAPAAVYAYESPYESPYGAVVPLGPTADGSVRGCLSNINPNCVSTASITGSYGPAWRADAASPAAAAGVLEETVAARLEGSRLLRAAALGGGAEYRAFGVPSLFGQDVLEFVIKPGGVGDRGWAGDTPGGQLVTYRSMAGSVKYVWPIQTPISDFDAQRKRLGELREALGWQVIGCELLECFQ